MSVGAKRARLWFLLPLPAAELHTYCSVEHSVFFLCPETFPPHWSEAVQFRQGGFQDVHLGKKPEILLKADHFCSVPPSQHLLIPGELIHRQQSPWRFYSLGVNTEWYPAPSKLLIIIKKNLLNRLKPLVQ